MLNRCTVKSCTGGSNPPLSAISCDPYHLLAAGSYGITDRRAGSPCFSFLDELVHIHGVLVRLLAELMGGQVIAFAMGHGRRRVRVGSKVMEFCSSLVWYL